MDGDAEAFGKLIDGAPKPVFAYSRTGTRSITLWSLGARRSSTRSPAWLSVGRGGSVRADCVSENRKKSAVLIASLLEIVNHLKPFSGVP